MDLNIYRDAPVGLLRRLGAIELVSPAPAPAVSLETISHVDPDVGDVSDLEISEGVAAGVEQALERRAFTLVHGGMGSGRRSLLRAVAHARGLQLLEVDGRAIATDRELARQQLRRIARECLLLDLVPLISCLESLEATGDVADRIDLVERELSRPVLATASHAIARRWLQPPSVFKLGPLLGPQQARLWARALPMASRGDCELLASMYPVAPAIVEATGRAAREQCGSRTMTPEHIEAGLRIALDARLAGLATPVDVTQTWSDIVLADDQTAAISELVSRVRGRRRVYEAWGFAKKVGRGLGVSALFSGPPGTGGPRSSSCLVARELRVELFQVDASKVVSKYFEGWELDDDDVGDTLTTFYANWILRSYSDD